MHWTSLFPLFICKQWEGLAEEDCQMPRNGWLEVLFPPCFLLMVLPFTWLWMQSHLWFMSLLPPTCPTQLGALVLTSNLLQTLSSDLTYMIEDFASPSGPCVLPVYSKCVFLAFSSSTHISHQVFLQLTFPPKQLESWRDFPPNILKCSCIVPSSVQAQANLFLICLSARYPPVTPSMAEFFLIAKNCPKPNKIF